MPAAAEAPSSQGQTATTLYDYEAAEGNELSFPEGAKITNVVCIFIYYCLFSLSSRFSFSPVPILHGKFK